MRGGVLAWLPKYNTRERRGKASLDRREQHFREFAGNKLLQGINVKFGNHSVSILKPGAINPRSGN